jgi:hypothetical protein
MDKSGCMKKAVSSTACRAHHALAEALRAYIDAAGIELIVDDVCSGGRPYGANSSNVLYSGLAP